MTKRKQPKPDSFRITDKDSVVQVERYADGSVLLSVSDARGEAHAVMPKGVLARLAEWEGAR